MKAKVGLNFKNQIAESILNNIEHLDIIEVYTERFFRQTDEVLQKIIDRLPLSLHGLDLSLGSEGELDQQYLQNIKSVLNNHESLAFSDHLSLTKSHNIEVGHLMPIAFNHENVENISRKIKKVQALTKRPFLLENITYYYKPPMSNYKEIDFFKTIISTSDCGILLDLNNLYINAKNHQYSPYEFIKALPKERIKELHLAGGSYKFSMEIDSHANDISPEVFKLLVYTLKLSKPDIIIIERDDNIQSFTQLMDEVKAVRKYL